MLNEIFHYLRILSSLHVVPYYKWTQDAKKILDTVLEGIPYCFTPHGNIFLGEHRIEDIQPGRVCLQAHLDHPGGILHADQQAYYLLAKYYGTNAKLFGHELGVYKPGMQDKIALLEVEHTVYHADDRAACLFFKPHQQLFNISLEETLIVHYDASPEMKDGIISNWNIDNLINCALILAFMKKGSFSDKFYAFLSLNEESEQEGIREFLSNLADKRLFFINLDVIDHALSLHNIDDEPYQHAYGICMEQSGVKLNQFLGSRLVKHVRKDYLARIPTERSEAHILKERQHPFMGIFLKIARCHNEIKQKKLTDERICLETLSYYIEFVKNTLEKMSEQLSPQHVSVFTAPLVPDPIGTIHLIDHVEATKYIFERCQTFSEYLHTGVPKLRMIYDQYAFSVPNPTMENFKWIRKNILHGKFPEVQTSRIYEWKTKILGELSKLFDHSILLQDKPVTVVKLLLANFNAAYLSQIQRILLSVEKISEREFDRLLIHELVHYLTSDVWSSQYMSPVRKEYYNEGLAIALSQKLSDSTLADALYMTEEELLPYMENRAQLAGWFEEYASGNMCAYFNGSYHQYFHKKCLPEPFTATGQQYQRYGYVLAALETMELIDKGDYYEQLFCQSIS